MCTDMVGRPLRFILTPGQHNDCTQGAALLEGMKADHVLADKGYDSEKVLSSVTLCGASPVIPPRVNRKAQRKYDAVLYKERNKIERTFSKLKQLRRIATRYERNSQNYLSLLHLAALLLWVD